jgi:hypothetical protein
MMLTCPVCGWHGFVYYQTCPPTYCSDACKQKAYRRRHRAEPVTGNENGRVTGLTRPQIEREIDMALHLLKCDCGRSIWTVLGNVQIGGLACRLCDGEFKPVKRKEIDR